MKRRPIAVLALAVTLAASACGSGTESTSAGPPPTTVAEEAGDGSLEFFVASALPNGLAITEATMFRRAEPPAETWAALIGIPDGAGHRDVISAFVATLSADELVDDGDDAGYTPIQIGSVNAQYNRNELTGTIVQWRDGERGVGVQGSFESKDEVIEAARHLRVGGRGKVTDTRFDGFPSGYVELVAAGGPSPAKRNDYLMSAHSSAQPPTTVNIAVRLVQPYEVDRPLFAHGTEIRPRRVRGKAASIGTTRSSASGHKFSQVDVTWRERSDMVVSVSGLISEDAAVSIAEGLEKRTEAQWRAELNVKDYA